jgi:hypothetical protein
MANVIYCNDSNLCKNNYYYALVTEFVPNLPPMLPAHHTGIADSSSIGPYLVPNAPVANCNPQALAVVVCVANCLPKRLVASGILASATALPPAASLGHVMPNFPHTLIGLGLFADQDCTIIFTQTTVAVYHSDGHLILSGWRDETGLHLWYFPLTTKAANPRMQPVRQLLCCPSQLLLCFLCQIPVSHNCPNNPQWSFCQPCLRQHTLIPARASLPPTRPGVPAWSTTCMAQPRLLPWLPVPQVPHLTHAALISPALVPWLVSIMPAWAFLSSKCGSMPSKLATATPLMASPTPMQPGTVQMLMQQSWAILPSNIEMSGRQNPSQLCWCL